MGREFVAGLMLGAACNHVFQILQFYSNGPLALLLNGSVPLAIARNKVSKERNQTAPSLSMSDLEVEVIGLFVQISRIIGQPRSYAEIYAVLFLSPDPLTMDELIEPLGISRGSASQGLSFLRKAGAIRMVLIRGHRSAHYAAVAELRQLVAGFLRDQVLPEVEESQNRLNQIAEMAGRLPAKDRAHVSGRVSMLQSWGKRSRQFLPLVVKLIGA
jgi:DNA-binding transcriptional regulator GbsR (MarR family)